MEHRRDERVQALDLGDHDAQQSRVFGAERVSFAHDLDGSGNGAERVLGNKDIGASTYGLNFNRHTRGHLLRSAQEGIVFALRFGFDVMKDMGMKMNVVRAGEANMFLSPIFREGFVHTNNVVVELYNTDGSQGAARAAGVGAGIYKDFTEAFQGLEVKQRFEPDQKLIDQYEEKYQKWLNILNKKIL